MKDVGIDHDTVCVGVLLLLCDTARVVPAARVLCRIAVPTMTAQTV